MDNVDINLTKKQNEAYSLMSQGASIYLTGPAGTGKTSLIKMFNKNYNKIKNIAITSTTGTSALLIGGTTLHSFLGIGLGKGSVDALSTLIFKRPYLRKRWCELHTLIIDEISMMSPDLFDKLEEIARVVRHNNRPFGGIQLILSGDFLQLPCIGSEKFCNEAKSWKDCISKIVHLDEIIRQGDMKFKDCLNHIRLGNLRKKDIALLNSRVGVKLTNDFGIVPTKLFPLNRDVDYVNDQELEKLAKTDPEFYQYDMEITMYKRVRNRSAIVDKFKKNCLAPETLQLCVGAQVMLLCNMDMEAKLANGSRGIIVGFQNDLPTVKFLNGVERTIDYHTWESEENDVRVLQASQIPLKLAYACSIHKIQGITLDYVEISLSEVFEYGQAYVALSRVKSLKGLNIIDFDPDRIVAHPKAVGFYEGLE